MHKISPITVIILAGGLGTRLASKVPDKPKALAPINGTPFLDLVFVQLSVLPINKVILSVGHLHHQIINHYGNSHLGLRVEYAVESIPLGTGGALKHSLGPVDTKDMLVINGDTYLDSNTLYTFLEAVDRVRMSATILVRKPNGDDRYGGVTLVNGMVKEFSPRLSDDMSFINAGVYYFSKNYIQQRVKTYSDTFSLESNLLADLAARNELNAIIAGPKSMFLDIGVPRDYELAQQVLFSK